MELPPSVPDVAAHVYEPPATLERLGWRMDDHESRIKKIEAADPHLMAHELRRVSEELRQFRRTLYVFIVGVATALLVYVVQGIIHVSGG